MGIPAIGSNIYGISDAILDKETGLLFHKGSIQSLVESIKNIIDDDELRLNLGHAAHVNVQKNFDADKVVISYLNFIREVVNKCFTKK
jgi:glycosyltransferase involved in cell wall biosynthesis